MLVLVTRAAPDGERTAAALAERGFAALLAPVLEIRPTRETEPGGRFDAILATSAHAFVVPLADRLRRQPLYAVGESTARAARHAGIEDVRVSRGDGRDLASLVALTLPRPAGLLYLAGRDRKAATERALAEAGYEVTVWVAYAAEAVAAWSDDVLEDLAAGRVAVALHYSARSAGLTLEVAVRGGVLEHLLGLSHLCLSDDVAGALRAAGAPQVRVAAKPDEASLLALLGDEAR